MPRLLTPDQLRFECKRGLQSLPRSVLRDLVGKPEARERALDQATTILAARFAGCQIVAPEPHRLDFGDMKNG